MPAGMTINITNIIRSNKTIVVVLLKSNLEGIFTNFFSNFLQRWRSIETIFEIKGF